jgi:hypothetical protein
MYGGSPGEHDRIYAQMEVEALARGEPVIESPSENRAVRLIRGFMSFLLLVLVVGGGAWLAGGKPETVVGAVALSLAALVLIVMWRKLRSGGQIPGPTENQ